MTREEAKEIIVKERDSMRANPMLIVEDCLYEAFDMAIKALEQESVLDKIKAEIEQDAFKGVDGVKYTFIPRVNRIIDKYRAESEK